ncbi:hypothetical protein H0G86_006362 [Trichoderma simmonsii]|uniref:Uncharacterized protein n=1 Tax=Trichoderma simmonsii TaxID=1491479 RepID=A0A8G0LGD8_9HYPO|nr:hypothetical protein H0G86_006362 [Trichoderma simmonsii]
MGLGRDKSPFGQSKKLFNQIRRKNPRGHSPAVDAQKWNAMKKGASRSRSPPDSQRPSRFLIMKRIQRKDQGMQQKHGPSAESLLSPPWTSHLSSFVKAATCGCKRYERSNDQQWKSS